MRKSIRDYAGFAVTIVLLSGVVVAAIWGIMTAAIWFSALVEPPPARCTVALATGETVTRYGCRAGNRGSGVLYCAEVDYAPAAWVTVTCAAWRP